MELAVCVEPARKRLVLSTFVGTLRFHQRSEYLKEFAYPVLKEICEFWEERLIIDANGALVTPDGWSPEHGPHEPGVTYDQEIIWICLQTISKPLKFLIRILIIGQGGGHARKLLKPQIGKWGQLMEWSVDRDDSTDTHRHISHLFALHPGRQISVTTTPALAAAAKKILIAVVIKVRAGNGLADKFLGAYVRRKPCL